MTSVLYAEDDPMIREVFHLLMKDYRVTSTDSVVGLAKLADESTYDVAILDINIIGGNTFTVGESLLAKGTPVIFLSGSPMNGLPEGAYYLGKPAPFRDVTDLITYVTTQRVSGDQ